MAFASEEAEHLVDCDSQDCRDSEDGLFHQSAYSGTSCNAPLDSCENKNLIPQPIIGDMNDKSKHNCDTASFLVYSYVLVLLAPPLKLRRHAVAKATEDAVLLRTRLRRTLRGRPHLLR